MLAQVSRAVERLPLGVEKLDVDLRGGEGVDVRQANASRTYGKFAADATGARDVLSLAGNGVVDVDVEGALQQDVQQRAEAEQAGRQHYREEQREAQPQGHAR